MQYSGENYVSVAKTGFLSQIITEFRTQKISSKSKTKKQGLNNIIKFINFIQKGPGFTFQKEKFRMRKFHNIKQVKVHCKVHCKVHFSKSATFVATCISVNQNTGHFLKNDFLYKSFRRHILLITSLLMQELFCLSWGWKEM